MSECSKNIESSKQLMPCLESKKVLEMDIELKFNRLHDKLAGLRKFK